MPRSLAFALTTSLTLALALTACGSSEPAADATPRDGASGDAGDAADGGRTDAGADPAPDGGNAPGDAGAGEGLAEVQWKEELRACSPWREGRTADEEAAGRLELVLSPTPRVLTREALAAATVPTGYLRTGTSTAIAIEPAATTTTLDEWRLEPAGAGAQVLTAQLSYPLRRGVLTELYSVLLRDGVPSTVVIGQSAEHIFQWTPTGGVPVVLEPCRGVRDGLEDAVEVITAETRGATRSVTLLRELRTAQTVAGSAPIYIQAVEIHDSAYPGEPIGVRGYWPLVYAAQHHNWDETFRVAPALDPGAWRSPYTRLEARGIAGGVGNGTLELDEVLEGGRTQRVRLGFRTRAWARVDATALGRGHGCAGAAVSSLASYDRRTVLQLLTCAGAGPLGFTVSAVRPVAFMYDPSVTDGPVERLTATPTGYRFTAGRAEVELVATDFGAVELVVREGGVERLRNAATPIPLALDRHLDTVVKAATRDERVVLTLVRRATAQGVGNSTIYGPIYASLRRGDAATGRTVHFVDTTGMRYGNTHHNWADELEADGDDYRLRWKVDLDQSGVEFLIHTVSLEPLRPGLPALPPTTLYEVREE